MTPEEIHDDFIRILAKKLGCYEDYTIILKAISDLQRGDEAQKYKDFLVAKERTVQLLKDEVEAAETKCAKDGLDLGQIIQHYLQTHGYDGLYEVGGECGCLAEDLVPCDSPNLECQPGIMVEGCTCGAGCRWHIVPRPDTKERTQ